MMFQVGETYQRAELAKILGGSAQSYLPTLQNRVLFGCFQRKLNPEAPLKVHIGEGSARLSAARCAITTGMAFPVFLQENADCEYQGRYRAHSYVKVVEPYTNEAGEPIAGVLFLERVSD